MEGLVQNQEFVINILKTVAFVFCFLVIVGLVVYNWLYLSKILKSRERGLRPPQHIHHLVRTCIYVPLVMALCIFIFIIFRIY